jgi:hypothetical protein
MASSTLSRPLHILTAHTYKPLFTLSQSLLALSGPLLTLSWPLLALSQPLLLLTQPLFALTMSPTGTYMASSTLSRPILTFSVRYDATVASSLQS